MQVYSDDERMFRSFATCFTHGVVVGEIARRGMPVFVGVDLSSASRPGNVIFVAALDPITQRRYPLEILMGNWTSPETAQRIADVNARHAVRYIIVENNAYQQSLVDWIRHAIVDHSFWYKVETFTTGRNKANPQYGLPSLEVEFKNKAWVVPVDEFAGHDPSCRCGWCVWSREVVDYPVGATADTVMAMWFCREAMARWGGAGTGSLNIGDINTR
jgi:hypothetical protein